jgi:Holliday junction resolvase
MTGRKKVPDDVLIESYRRLGGVAKVGEEVGLCGQSVHERLSKLGLVNPINVFTEGEIDRLKSEYWIAAEAGKLADLAADMGRTKQFICRKARDLGLTRQDRSRPYGAVWKYVTEEYALPIWEDFKKSSMNLGAYCHKKGYDDLGFSKCMKKYFGDEWENVIELKQFKQTRYRIGRALEYRVRDHLRSLGYFAQRSPASKTPVDITAIATGLVLLVQCKRGGSLPVGEWNEIFDLAKSCGAVPIMAASPTGRGVDYFELLDRKDGSKRRQPMRPFEPVDMRAAARRGRAA